jgi:CubicO group peptidase (beta-lactamase class C family)
VIYEAAFGWADKERRLAATTRTPYPLASVTKPLIATGLMLLAERGQVDLDAPAQPGAVYTLRQLLNHSSGLGTYATIDWPDDDRRLEPLTARLRDYGFIANPPGTVSEYSNLGYGLIGQVIAEHSRRSLGDFMQAEVFDPLGLRETRLVDSPLQPPGAARKYAVDGQALADTYNDTPGAGNIYASVHDLVRFGVFQLSVDTAQPGPAIGAGETVDAVMATGISSYYNPRATTGWYFRTEPDGRRGVARRRNAWSSAILLMMPKQGVAAAS